MSGMCKSDARQNSRNKTHYQKCEAKKTWETHKAKRKKREMNKIEKRAKKIQSRIDAGKPVRGHARKLRRTKKQVGL